MNRKLLNNLNLLLISGFMALNFQFSGVYAQNDRKSQEEFFRRSAEIVRLNDSAYLSVEPFFRRAYELYPSVPRGFLEAVSYYYTRYHFFAYDRGKLLECDSSDIPQTYGVMGLTLDGRGVFRDNLKYVSQLSGIPVREILYSPMQSVVAYTAAFAKLQDEMNIFSKDAGDYIPILLALSELPLVEDWHTDYATQSYLYSIFVFLSDSGNCSKYGIPKRKIDMKKIFGAGLDMLERPIVTLTSEGVVRAQTDYAEALWQAAGACNYTAMQSRDITAVTIHYTSGTYAGSIAWFKNCTYNGVGSRASAHYVIRSSDGQITQMVREKDKAWHVRTENGYTIGIEHEAYGDIVSYFTPEMYNSSAALVRDICGRQHINPHRTFYRDTLDDGACLNVGTHSLGGSAACTQIRGHQHFPNQTHTDPGPYWDWNYYYKLLNPNPEIEVFTSVSGVLTDSGGENGNYGNDERSLYLIEVPDAKQITLEFEDFALEKDYDFLWIYDGNSVYSPKLGRWNTASPGKVISSGNALLLEFRSDCATTAIGWKARWHADCETVAAEPVVAPVTKILLDENKWQTKNFTVAFKDTGELAIQQRFYQVIENDGVEWRANGKNGFLCSNFDRPLSETEWQPLSGYWKVLVHRLEQTDMEANEAVVSIPFNPSQSDVSLYDAYVNILENDDANYSVGVYFWVDNNTSVKNGYLLGLCPTDKTIKLFRYKNGVKTLLKSVGGITINLNQNYLYRIFHDKKKGIIKVFRHGAMLFSITDIQPPVVTNGYFMLSTKKCRVAFDNLRAYKSRDNQVPVTVGQYYANDVRCQALGGVPKCKIKSLIVDSDDNFSQLDEKLVLVDYTAPPKPKWVDVVPNDIVNSVGKISDFKISWEDVGDIHSSPVEYLCLLDPCEKSVIEKKTKWVSVGALNEIVQTVDWKEGKLYRLRVKAQNQAGLVSGVAISAPFGNGGKAVNKTLTSVDVATGNFAQNWEGVSAEQTGEKNDDIVLYPNPATNSVNIIGMEGNEYVEIYNMSGLLVQKSRVSKDSAVDVTALASGEYIVKINGLSCKLVKY